MKNLDKITRGAELFAIWLCISLLVIMVSTFGWLGIQYYNDTSPYTHSQRGYRVEKDSFEGHTYLIFDTNASVVHDQNCPCKKGK